MPPESQDQRLTECLSQLCGNDTQLLHLARLAADRRGNANERLVAYETLLKRLLTGGKARVPTQKPPSRRPSQRAYAAASSHRNQPPQGPVEPPQPSTEPERWSSSQVQRYMSANGLEIEHTDFDARHEVVCAMCNRAIRGRFIYSWRLYLQGQSTETHVDCAMDNPSWWENQTT